MMATIIDELMITLGIDSKDAQKGMKEAENTVKGGIKNITSAKSFRDLVQHLWEPFRWAPLSLRGKSRLLNLARFPDVCT